MQEEAKDFVSCGGDLSISILNQKGICWLVKGNPGSISKWCY